MHNWFQCKVKYERNAEDGSIAKVSESYLVDALSFTEAEERINDEMKPYISGDFLVSDIKRARISELFEDEAGDKWYRSKVFFISLDEEKGVEKKTATTMFAQACTLKEAVELIDKGMKTSLSDYEIASVTETNVMDVFKYHKD